MSKQNPSKKKLFFLFFFYLTAMAVFSQQNNAPIDANKIAKLQKKYAYVSRPSNEGTFLTAINPKTNNQVTLNYENIRVVDINGKIIKEKELSSYRLEITMGDKNENFPHTHCIIDASNKVGLITTTGEIILPPTYDHINDFNSKGQAVAFSGTDLQVIDTNGKPLLTEKYKSNSDMNIYWGYLPDNKYRFSVINDNVICGIDEKHYGIVNVLTNKTVVPFEYEKIGDKLFIDEKDTIGYFVSKNNRATILDFKTKKEIAPFPFEKIQTAFIYNNSIYIDGQNNSQTTRERNYYDVKNKKMVFDSKISLEKAVPYDQIFWKYEKDGISYLYNTVKNEVVKIPEEATNIRRLTDNLALYSIRVNGKTSSWIFDLTQNKFLHKYASQVDSYSFTLKKGITSREYFFITEKKIPNDSRSESTTMYDRNLKTYFTDLHLSTSYYENDRIVIKEEVNGQYPNTAYDIDGNVIGNIREYKMK